MFAVKGWNVDASTLKPQTAVFKSSSTQNAEQKQGRKRKRQSEVTTNNDDVGQLWEQHIEGKKPAKKQGKKLSNKEKKRQKLQEVSQKYPNNLSASKSAKDKAAPGAAGAAGAQKGAAVLDLVPEKRSKKRKTESNNKRRVADAAKSDRQDLGGMPSVPAERVANAVSMPIAPVPAGAKLTPMQSAMRQKLVSARFRHLNQTLYTEPSAKALELFDANPDMFEDYHSGFRQQVAVWPENPVDNLIATIRSRGKIKMPSQKKAFKKKVPQIDVVDPPESGYGLSAPLPRTHGTSIIADLGCGDARIAQTLKESGDGQTLQLKVHSYDLHSPSPLVTKADISHIPTADGSIDIAIFCLALMGTNWISFIEEAYRILHWKGELWISEIKSRFGRAGRSGKPVEHSVGGKRKQAAIKKAHEANKREALETNEQEALAVEVDGVETQNAETDVSAFVDVLKRRGFILKNGDSSVDLGNKMFVKMEFVKAAPPTKGKNVQEQSPSKSSERFRKPKAKFLDDHADELASEDEAKVLKPCLYKIR